MITFFVKEELFFLRERRTYFLLEEKPLSELALMVLTGVFEVLDDFEDFEDFEDTPEVEYAPFCGL